jgi:single-strand DNA-binding protein
MADGLNKVILIGNLGADPVHRVTSSNKDVAEIRVATTESWKNESGEKQQSTEWHMVVVWGRTAVNVKEYLSKGSQVYVEGKIKTRKWQDQTTGQDRYTTEVVANKIMFLSSSQRGASQGSGGNDGYSGSKSPGAPPQGNFGNDMNDDIPF